MAANTNRMLFVHRDELETVVAGSGGACVLCGVPAAWRGVVAEGEAKQPVCARCFLYVSPWGLRNKDTIASRVAYATRLAAETNTRRSSGSLAHVPDIDDSGMLVAIDAERLLLGIMWTALRLGSRG